MAPDSVPGITMRQLAEFTCPAFPQRPRRQSKSSAVHRRTFAELTCWSEFKPGVTSMLSCMDNTERRFRVPDIGGEVDNEEERVDMVADDESEVRGIFTFVFNSVNRMAVRRGCRAAFQGGGLKSSSADGMAYSKDGPPSTDRSSNVLMMLEFKGMWQFELPEDVKGLAEVLETEAGKDLLHTLIQQGSARVACHLLGRPERPAPESQLPLGSGGIRALAKPEASAGAPPGVKDSHSFALHTYPAAHSCCSTL
ncbi:hypothetical protein WJX84_003679 [Apatococcus fuscideae]|uniref:Uncharacterized protein n=1 Tax=Apatococcus fuscideae TaxID=2026836 RepID=A0AAW1SM78_9CHLO